MESRKLRTVASTVCAFFIAHILTISAWANDDDSTIEEVVVIGTKVGKSVQETPNSVTVIGAAELEDENLLNITDVLYRTPNALPVGGGTGFSLRGIGNQSVAGGGFADLATIYLDNAPLSRDTIQIGAVDTWDLEQIEVLRGPQSTLQGRNSLGGAIIMKTADPSYEWEARARVQALDEIDETRIGVAFGGPIIEDQLAFRVAYETADSDGLIDNPTRGENASENESDVLRVKLLIEPEAIPDLTVRLSHSIDDREFGLRESFFPPNADFDDRLIFSNRPTSDQAETTMSVVDINYVFNETFDLTLISTISDAERERERDLDYTAADIEFGTLFSDTETTTNELRLGINTDNFYGVLGLYTSEVDNPESRFDITFSINPITDVGLVDLLQVFAGLDPATAAFVGSFYTEDEFLTARQVVPSNVKTQAIFGDFTWDINEKWSLLFGFRYDNEEQEIEGAQEVIIASELPDPATFPAALAPAIAGANAILQVAADQANSPPTLDDTDISQFLPKLGVSYRIDDDQMISFIVQQGYRSGGVSTNAARARVVQYDEETTINYELSYRSQWMDGRLTVNGNIFYNDWEDQQVTVFLSSNIFDAELQNAGKSELFGIEVETDYIVNDNFNVYFSAGYTDTEFKEFIALVDGGFEDLSGNEFPSAPSWTFSAGGTWTHEDGWFVNVNANHTSHWFNTAADIQDSPTIPERTIVNLKAGWRNDNIGVYLIGRNIFDDEYYDTQFEDPMGNELGRYGQPQIFGISVEANL
ncbi:MAG: TonB-dependent receptor [Pseudomonadota bacterium]